MLCIMILLSLINEIRHSGQFGDIYHSLMEFQYFFPTIRRFKSYNILELLMAVYEGFA